MQNEFPTAGRTFGAVSKRLRLILSSIAVLGGPTDGLARNQADALWHNEQAKLRDAMFKNFADPGVDKVVLANSPKWASEPYPPNMEGVDIENKFFEIPAGDSGCGEFTCLRQMKSTGHNFYTSIQTEIQFRPPPMGK